MLILKTQRTAFIKACLTSSRPENHQKQPSYSQPGLTLQMFFLKYYIYSTLSYKQDLKLSPVLIQLHVRRKYGDQKYSSIIV